MRGATVALLLVLCSFPMAVSRSSTTASRDGYELLQRVAQHYANAKSYHLRATFEYRTWSKMQRNWEKTIWDVAEAPGNRYRYEGESGNGHALRVSNGNDVWTYHVEERAYTRAAFSDLTSATHSATAPAELALSSGSRLRADFASLAKTYKSAARLPDSEITVDGKRIDCYVLQLKTLDERRKRADESSERTLWIEKSNDTILKDHLKLLASAYSGVVFEAESTTIYKLRELDLPLQESLFTFVAPEHTRIVQRFADNTPTPGNLEGKLLPTIKITTADGKQFSTDSVRGQPVLLDLWASWCQPCVEELDSLAAIYPRALHKLSVITIDQDEEAENAAELIARKKYPWPNVHDDGNIASALGGIAGFPRTILIAADGKVIYDKTGYDEEDLHKAISSLGSEYAALLPAQPPCTTEAARK